MYYSEERTLTMNAQMQEVQAKYRTQFQQTKKPLIFPHYVNLLHAFKEAQKELDCSYDKKRYFIYTAVFDENQLLENLGFYLTSVDLAGFNTDILTSAQNLLHSLTEGLDLSIDNLSQYIQVKIIDPVWNFHHHQIAFPPIFERKTYAIKGWADLPAEIHMHILKNTDFATSCWIDKSANRVIEALLIQFRMEVTKLYQNADRDNLLIWLEKVIKKNYLPYFWEKRLLPTKLFQKAQVTPFNNILRNLVFSGLPLLGNLPIDLSNCDLDNSDRFGNRLPNPVTTFEGKTITNAKNGYLCGVSFKKC